MTPSLDAPLQLSQLANHHAGARPHAPALQFEGEVIDYRELARRVDGCAAQLQLHWRVQPGERVAWLGLNHPGQLVLLLALARLGALLLPLNFRLAPAEWAGQLRDCRPSHMVHDAAWADAARELAAQCGAALHPVHEILADPPAGADPTRPSTRDRSAPDAPLLLVYTSGTTGQPRAAVHTQANLLANMRIAARVQAMTADDRVLTVLPLFHVGGLCIQTLPAWYAGASVILHPRFDAGATLASIERERPTLTLQVPATMKALIDHPDWTAVDLSSLRAVWAGSSVLPPALVRAFVDRGVALCNVYGSTESGPFSIALPPAFATSHAGSCGWPAPEVEAWLEGNNKGKGLGDGAGDGEGDGAGEGERDGECEGERDGEGEGERVGSASGELLLRGPNVVRRYWPAQPACDADGWLHTGDLATRAADGSYTVVGRVRDLIISGGENIHPVEVEDAAAAHPAVAECAAFGLPHPQWGEAVALAVVCRPGAALSSRELRQHLEGRLARFKQPRHVFFVERLPTTALGKLQRSALVARFSGS